jgi:DNA-binding sugar fermentation-stimulating protein
MGNLVSWTEEAMYLDSQEKKLGYLLKEAKKKGITVQEIKSKKLSCMAFIQIESKIANKYLQNSLYPNMNYEKTTDPEDEYFIDFLFSKKSIRCFIETKNLGIVFKGEIPLASSDGKKILATKAEVWW